MALQGYVTGFKLDGSWKYSLNESCWIWTDLSVRHFYWIPLLVVLSGEVSCSTSRWVMLIHSVQYPIIPEGGERPTKEKERAMSPMVATRKEQEDACCTTYGYMSDFTVLSCSLSCIWMKIHLDWILWSPCTSSRGMQKAGGPLFSWWWDTYTRINKLELLTWEMKECKAPLSWPSSKLIANHRILREKRFRHLVRVTSGEFDHQPPFSPRLSIFLSNKARGNPNSGKGITLLNDWPQISKIML